MSILSNIAAMVSPSSLDKLPAALAAVAPHLPDEAVSVWTSALTPPMRSSGITTPRRIAAFLGMVAEESGGFSVQQECLRYSNPARLCAVWPSRFPTQEAATPYVNNPEALADLVYAGRMGNGNAASGDGWRFRGEGLIQLTGRGMHTRFAASVGRSLDDAAAWMLTPPGASASACWFWTLADHKPALNALADTWDLTGITRAINGGLTGLTARVAGCSAALAAL